MCSTWRALHECAGDAGKICNFVAVIFFEFFCLSTVVNKFNNVTFVNTADIAYKTIHHAMQMRQADLRLHSAGIIAGFQWTTEAKAVEETKVARRRRTNGARGVVSARPRSPT
jgi:hypothetical protein